MTRAFDSDGQIALVMSAATGHATRQYLRTFRKEPAQFRHVLVIYGIYLIDAKTADLPAAFSAAAPVAAVASVASVRSFISWHIINLLS